MISFASKGQCLVHQNMGAKNRLLRTPWCSRGLAGGALIFCLLTPVAYAELILFPSLNLSQRTDSGTEIDLDDRELVVGADLFYSRDFGRLRVLGELLLSEKEADLERLQVGWQALPETTLWLGRFHTPLGYWHAQYHHGSFLETSISHPAITNYEDNGGILPTHATGLLVQTSKNYGASSLNMDLGLGAGPELRQQLEAMDVLSPGTGRHKLNASLRIAYHPDALGPRVIGVFLNHSRIPGAGPAPREVELSVAGLYANWEKADVRLFGAAFAVANRLDRGNGGTEQGSFVSAYLQGEWNHHPQWTFYGRVEGAQGVDNDPYLALFPNFVRDRTMTGVRFDLSDKHALKLEVANIRRNRDHYRQINLQWSAALP